MSKSLIISILIASFLYSCKNQSDGPLPFIGQKDIVDGDTIYHQIPDFSFVNQDNEIVSNGHYKDQLYIADFFFIHCPAICPKVRQQMLRIYDKYEDDGRVKLVSHTLDPVRDTVDALAKYAEKLDVVSTKWDFLTGERDEIWDIADEYFVAAVEDPTVEGGFDHSGRIILVDKDRHVRGFAEGTDPEDVTKFLNTIDQLLVEYEGE